jgi:DNA-binding beta-propeller fold protein YncE
MRNALGPTAALVGAVTLTALLALACLASRAHAGDRVYWANDKSSTSRISFADLDGSGGGNLSTVGASSGQPRGVAIDVAAGKVYWTNPDNNRISFANLDGSGGGGDLNTAGATVDRPNAAAVYPAAGKVYWANEWGDRISFANLNNTGGGNLITTGATVDVPIEPTVDPGSGRIYWGNANPRNVISFAKLDGSGGGDINTTGATVDNPHGVALDPVTGRIYWANVNGQRISWAKLDGSGGGDLNTTGATVNLPVGVAIDPTARKIYWGNEAANKISWANLDGSGAGDLSTPGATLNGSRSPALLQVPRPNGAPTISGGSTTGSVLTCSQGSWLPDLLGSVLYRVPQGFAYSWTLNGGSIGGASGSTYTASAAGDYRCTVAASNPAGSASQTSAAHAVSLPSSVAPPAFGTKTLVSMSLRARRIPAGGPITVFVANRNGFAVSGKLSAGTARRISGKRHLATRAKAFSVGARATAGVKLRMPKALRRLLRRSGKLYLRITGVVKDPAGNFRTVEKKVSLKLKQTRQRRSTALPRVSGGRQARRTAR